MNYFSMLPLNQLALNVPAATKPRVVVIGGGFGAVSLLESLPAFMTRLLMPIYCLSGFRNKLIVTTN